MQPKTHVKISLLIYALATLIIVGGHSFLENYGFHLNYTISRYIGLNTWSAILFLITSIFVFINIIKYLKYLKTTFKMGTVWWVIAIIMMASLLCVGLFPIGYFDEVYGDFGLVSILHRITSSTMFCISVLLVFLTALKFRTEKLLFFTGIMYAIYGLTFITLYALSVPILVNNIFIFESAFLVFFHIVLLLKQTEKRLDA